MNVSADKEYFEVIINPDSTYTVKTTTGVKPKLHELALSTLNNMEKVILEGLTYVATDPNYQNLSQTEVYTLFKEKAVEIDTNYSKAVSDSNWLYKLLFSKESQIHAVCTNIENLLGPSKGLSISDDLISHELTKYLDAKDIATLTKLNRETKRQATSPLLERAQEFGYGGTDEKQAAKYLNEFFGEVKLLSNKLLPKDRIVYNNKDIDLEATLNNLTAKDVFKLYNQVNFFEDIYSKSFDKIRNYFHSTDKIEPLKKCSAAIKKIGVKALKKAIYQNESKTVEFLLKIGANPNTSIHHAPKEITELLLQAGANPNIKNIYRRQTPLHYAVRDLDLEKVKLLLENGADPNIRDIKGKTALQLTRSKKIRALLKLYMDR